MPVTFIYKIGKNPKTFYGKMDSNNLSDDFPVDEEIKDLLVRGLTKYGLKNVNKKMFKVAVLSIYSNIYYTSNKENKVFDFVHKYNDIFWVNGKKL